MLQIAFILEIEWCFYIKYNDFSSYVWWKKPIEMTDNEETKALFK